MTDTLRLVDWDLATATASRFAPRGPRVTRPEAFDAVRQLRLLAVEAEDHVAAFTGLSAPHPHEQFGSVIKTLIRLVAHFALHRGQISYIRRLI